MPENLPPDRFDDVRREWIAFNQGDSLIQRRRAEQLGRIIRKRQRRHTVAVPDPHDDTVLPRIFWRQAKSRFSQIEGSAVLIAALIAPVAWSGGLLLKSKIEGLIPESLRGYPIAALVWSSVALQTVTALCTWVAHTPGGSPGRVVVVAWLALQLSLVPIVAGIYGILEGWLAVKGSDQWWPLTPAKVPLTAADAAAILGAYDVTEQPLVAPRPLNSAPQAVIRP